MAPTWKNELAVTRPKASMAVSSSVPANVVTNVPITDASVMVTANSEGVMTGSLSFMLVTSTLTRPTELRGGVPPSVALRDRYNI